MGQTINQLDPANTGRATAESVCRAPPRRLADLGLEPDDHDALQRQGFVSVEYRGRRGPFFKLRFRLDGRQRVVYLGQDVGVAEQVQHELAELQAHHKLEQRLARLKAEALALVRESKRRLQPYLHCAGLRFHGLEIRGTRTHPVRRRQQNGSVVSRGLPRLARPLTAINRSPNRFWNLTRDVCT